MRIDVARRFTKDCHELGITIHGTFILGLARREPRDHRGDHPLRHARSIRTPSRCRSRRPIPAPSFTARRSSTAGSTQSTPNSSTTSGVQIAPLHYPHLTHTEIFHSVEEFYRRFYFRAPKIASIVGEMVRSPRDDDAAAARRASSSSPSCANAGSSRTEPADHHGRRFRPQRTGQRRRRGGAPARHSERRKPHGRRGRRRRRGRAGAPAADVCASGCMSSWSMATPVSPPRRHIRPGRRRRTASATTCRVTARRSPSILPCGGRSKEKIAAQFEAYRATGLPLDHVNAHRHFHLHPVVAARDHRDRPAPRHAGAARSASSRGGSFAEIDPHTQRQLGRVVAPWAAWLRRRVGAPG